MTFNRAHGHSVQASDSQVDCADEVDADEAPVRNGRAATRLPRAKTPPLVPLASSA